MKSIEELAFLLFSVAIIGEILSQGAATAKVIQLIGASLSKIVSIATNPYGS